MQSSARSSTFSRNAEMRNLRFPQKLWIMANDGNGIAEWSRNGSAIRLDFEALDDYLMSKESIFRVTNHCVFERHMLLYGFKRIGTQASLGGRPSKEPTDMEFRNENFKRDRPHLVDSIQQCPIKNDTNLKILRGYETEIIERSGTKGDPCRRLKPKRINNPLTTARFRLQSVLQERYVRSMLSHKLDHCEQTNDWSIELEADVFENAVDSVSSFEQREVAGFYGHEVSLEQIKSFFGEYLPTYSNDEGLSSLNAASSGHLESFAIPQFQIETNDPNSSEVNQQYLLKSFGNTDDNRACGLNNQLIPIHYNIAGLEAEAVQNKTECIMNLSLGDQIKEEFVSQLKPKNEEENPDFEQFFLMKPKTSDQEMVTALNLSGKPIKLEHSKEDGNPIDALTNETDIMQQAAIIDDNFFSQIRESMDVLYDKVLC